MARRQRLPIPPYSSNFMTLNNNNFPEFTEQTINILSNFVKKTKLCGYTFNSFIWNANTDAVLVVCSAYHCVCLLLGMNDEDYLEISGVRFIRNNIQWFLKDEVLDIAYIKLDPESFALIAPINIANVNLECKMPEEQEIVYVPKMDYYSDEPLFQKGHITNVLGGFAFKIDVVIFEGNSGAPVFSLVEGIPVLLGVVFGRLGIPADMDGIAYSLYPMLQYFQLCTYFLSQDHQAPAINQSSFNTVNHRINEIFMNINFNNPHEFPTNNEKGVLYDIPAVQRFDIQLTKKHLLSILRSSLFIYYWIGNNAEEQPPSDRKSWTYLFRRVHPDITRILSNPRVRVGPLVPIRQAIQELSNLLFEITLVS